MKWFKHDSDASNDAKLRKLRLKYGSSGYGIYWYCLELIARNVEKHNLTFELEHDAELIADDFKLNYEIVQEMMAYMVNLGLFENVSGVITCIKMSTRTDEYTQKLIKHIKDCPDTIPTLSIDSPTKSELKEEKRREEKDNSLFSTFWELYPKKENKKKAQTAFNNLTKKKQEAAIQDIAERYKDTEKQFIPYPTTYINGERWEDETNEVSEVVYQ